MPVYDVGYRPWTGSRTPPGATAGVIATTGIRLAWTSHWLRRLVLFAWSPALVFAMSFFAFEQAIEEGRLTNMREAARQGRNLDGVGMLGTVLADTLGQARRKTTGEHDPGKHIDPRVDIAQTRRVVWSRLLLAFMRVPQAVLLAIIVGLVAPSLISRDLRAKAWLVYFTRPVSRWEYILGKAAILAALVGTITLLPALVLWFTGVLVSPSVWVAVDTWDLPVKTIAASVVLAVPTVLLALAYSSLTPESRIASFAWFATWAACWVAHSSMVAADGMAAQHAEAMVGRRERAALAERRAAQAPRYDTSVFDEPGTEPVLTEPRPEGRRRDRYLWLKKAAGMETAIDRWAWLSPYHALGVVQAWIFGTEDRWEAVAPSLLSIVVISAAAVAVLFNRIDAPTRV
jgi:ABC-2 type transport system permease protein